MRAIEVVKKHQSSTPHLPVVFKTAVELTASQSHDGIGAAHGPEHARLLAARTTQGLASGFDDTRCLRTELAAEFGVPHALRVPAFWEQAAEHLRAVPGVERVALAGWPLPSGTSARNFVSINGAPPAEEPVSFLNVSPGLAPAPTPARVWVAAQ